MSHVTHIRDSCHTYECKNDVEEEGKHPTSHVTHMSEPATHCKKNQKTATHCKTPQRTTHCNTLSTYAPDKVYFFELQLVMQRVYLSRHSYV